MIRSFLKKKLSDNTLANIFVNGLLEVIDNGFKDVAALINEDPAFEESPQLLSEQSGEFTMIVIVGNIVSLELNFDAIQATNVETLIIQKFAGVFGKSETEFENLVKEYKAFIARVNHPSKNVLYGMSKAVFHKYNLNDFQDDYFKRMQAPNPLFLKRMDEVLQNFIWNWDAILKKYKL
ncbi:MAG: hypothetical protein KA264_02075 [Crocinitomicaceae bacterium]|nr:hypothetical protein [Crocinitomicaceae bacterium]